MGSCNEDDATILRYLENELNGRENAGFSAHLKICVDCAKRLEDERNLSRLLRRSGPLYLASAELRARVSATVILQPAAPHPPEGFYRRALQFLKGRPGFAEEVVSRGGVLREAAKECQLCCRVQRFCRGRWWK